MWLDGRWLQDQLSLRALDMKVMSDESMINTDEADK
jgi:hypothetical protein